MSSEFSIEFAPNGRNGNGTVTVRLGDDLLAVESLNLTKPKARGDFIARLCIGRPGVDGKAIEAELLRLAAESVNKPEEKPATAEPVREIDVSSIVRPERFITPEVSGLAVPTMTIVDGLPAGRWVLYLRWANGLRESRLIPPALDLPDGRKLWIHPQPNNPTTNMPSGWSQESRRKWLAGSEPPNPAELFTRICDRIHEFIDLPEDHAAGTLATLTLWAILSYCYHAWEAVSYLFVGGPLGSGKSRVFDILGQLVFRPVQSSNMTAPTLFRTLDNQGGVLLFDEAERLKQSTPDVGEILSMLLAGYKRGGRAQRQEAMGDGRFKTVGFDVFGPKGLACITGLPPALSSRCIPLIMFRAAPGSPKPRHRINADPATWQALRDDLHVLALEHGSTWLDLPKRTDVCPSTISGRDFELWQPLLALACWIESHGASGLLGRVRSHALTIVDAGKEDSTPETDEILLRILAEFVLRGESPQPQDILDAARNRDPDTFPKNAWKPKGVATSLRRYGCRTNTLHGKKVYGKVTIAQLRKIQMSYGLDLNLPKDDSGDP